MASRYAAGKESLQMRAVALVFILSGLLYAMLYLSSNKLNAIVFLATLGIIGTLTNGAVFSAIQSLVDDRMRSVALALVFLLANLIGLGLGPVTVGVLSDLLAPMFGEESLRYALLLFSPGYLWVAYYYWKVANTIEADIRRVESGIDSTEDGTAKSTLNTHSRYAKNTVDFSKF